MQYFTVETKYTEQPSEYIELQLLHPTSTVDGAALWQLSRYIGLKRQWYDIYIYMWYDFM